MLILTAAQTPQPDPVALGMALALLAFVVFLALRKYIRSKKAPAPESVEAAAGPVAAVPAPGSAGALKLHDVEPKTAAMLMAIVAHKTGKPLNELRFLSIREVDVE